MKILVAGGCGMIGSNVARILKSQGHIVRVADVKKGDADDLRDRESCFFACEGMERIFHLADRTVGIGYSSTHHGQMLTDSLFISLNLLEAARKAGVKNYLYVSSSCVYADWTFEPGHPVIAKEEWTHGSVHPESANEGYGLAKRVAELQCVYYAREYGTRTVIARPANVFGPSYDWKRPVEDMHVIPALIVKMLRGDKEISAWGSGKQTRTFDYEADAALKIVALAEHGKTGEAYNLGGFELSIGDVVTLLAIETGYTGSVTYDVTKPEGPKRKVQDMQKLCDAIPPWDITEFQEGLKLTVEGARKALA